uniref:RRM domain-containing protein n=1 Tax=Aegilops tauschii subsp. strangulata TaxID=200361 RepID=A0A453I9V4_AEGTS
RKRDVLETQKSATRISRPETVRSLSSSSSAAAAAAAMLSGDVPPNQTVYFRNLNEKVKKEELKRSLYALCSQYGRIVDVVALKTHKLRGQAWVAFSEITAATNAFRGLQDFDFYGKKMV